MKHWTCGRSRSTESSGDFVECVELGEDRHAIMVGDVAGHDDVAGAAAAALRAYLRELVLGGVSQTDTLQLSSQYFSETVLTDAAPFASVFIAVVDLRAGTLRYVSAGHEAALIFNADGTHAHLCPTGPVLGLPGEPMYTECELRIRDGSLLVVVTDGITEARRDDDDDLVFFGTRGVVTAVRQASRDGSDPAEAISVSALQHAGGMFADDASVFVSSLVEVTRPTLVVSGNRER